MSRAHPAVEERKAPTPSYEQPEPLKASAGNSFLPCQFHYIYDFSFVQLSDWSEHVSELLGVLKSKNNTALKREGTMVEHSKVYVKQDQKNHTNCSKQKEISKQPFLS